MDQLRFDERVAIVTGAGGGLGRSYAHLLASRGALVVVNDLGGPVDGTDGTDGTAATRVVDEIIAQGGTAVADNHSVATRAGGAAIVETAVGEFGRVDIVINNAGIIKNRTLPNIGEAELEPVLAVHLNGAFHVTKPAYRLMREQGYGRVIMTSSASGLFGFFGQSAYGAAKMGLAGFTKTLALEGARYGIKVNAIAPGALTRMTGDVLGAGSPVGTETGLDEVALAERMSPNHVAPVVGYLAHESCSLTGEILSAMGGRVARTFVAQTPGIFDPRLTIEQIAESIDEICHEDGYIVPDSVDAETAELLRHLRPSARSQPN